MCLQDYRILDGLSLKQFSGTTDVAGVLSMPSLALAVLIGGESAGNSFILSWTDMNGNTRRCPSDTRYAGPAGNAFVYTRESLGPLITKPLRYVGVGAELVTAWWYEMDAETWARIRSAFYPPITRG